jgi:hypothetical protein
MAADIPLNLLEIQFSEVNEPFFIDSHCHKHVDENLGVNSPSCYEMVIDLIMNDLILFECFSDAMFYLYYYGQKICCLSLCSV